MLFDASSYINNPFRAKISRSYLQDETECVCSLLAEMSKTNYDVHAIQQQAHQFVTQLRSDNKNQSAIDLFLHEYDLSSQEGVILMCLAEALLRIPDPATADKLIKDKLAQSNWEQHIGSTDSFYVNAATWGLLLTGTLVNLDHTIRQEPYKFVSQLISRSGAPLVRAALKEAMSILGKMFILAKDIETAVAVSNNQQNASSRYSYDMLGEAARTAEDAGHYYDAYLHAIETLARSNADSAGISIKLTALHPRFELARREQVLNELLPGLVTLSQHAAAANIQLTIDAEESERLDLTLDIFAALATSGLPDHWQGLGIAVQAYQKRAVAVLEWLIHLAGKQQRRITVRLVKGAYWDSEIKHAQEQGLCGYPVFTRKAATDVSYLYCARLLLEQRTLLYPQFATHNAHTISAILHMAGNTDGYEFQRLHGMGAALYKVVESAVPAAPPCRIYAPVGKQADLLPYLVRRLLENGANTSFVNRIENPRIPAQQLVNDPIETVRAFKTYPNPAIPLPALLYGEQRNNSQGINRYDPLLLADIDKAISQARQQTQQAAPLINGVLHNGEPVQLTSPYDHQLTVGSLIPAQATEVDQAITTATQALLDWSRSPIEQRARIFEAAAELFERHKYELAQLVIDEAGRCLVDALAEIREAIDYCYYYAQQARRLFTPVVLQGPTGECNSLTHHARGVFVCISPWNFPVAIFTGQIVAALITGNTVVAKPASQTPLVACLIARLLFQAGVPVAALHIVPGQSQTIGESLLADERIAGVVFTGSTTSAQQIQKTLAQRLGPIIPFIAETAGINCMLTDSSALPEQLIDDVLSSAFNSAGQRCSALRVLYLQQDIAPRVMTLLKGAMAQLQIGHPGELATDIGPVIDHKAQQALNGYIQSMKARGKLVCEAILPTTTSNGSYVAPVVFEIETLAELGHEVFGPVLHVIRYEAAQLDTIIADINRSQYGLTLGIHSRIESTARYIQSRVRVGNIYVNRNMIGAVVGVQPFGGEGLSGTGPKAGGPAYLQRFVSERVVTTNTAAIGGNATLLSLQEENN